MNSDSVRGVCIRDVSGEIRFENRFELPVYLVDQAQNWLLLKPGERGTISVQSQFYIFMPPFADAQGIPQYSLKIEEIRSKIQTMFGGAP